jgi:hypothetical protein
MVRRAESAAGLDGVRVSRAGAADRHEACSYQSNRHRGCMYRVMAGETDTRRQPRVFIIAGDGGSVRSVRSVVLHCHLFQPPVVASSGWFRLSLPYLDTFYLFAIVIREG